MLPPVSALGRGPQPGLPREHGVEGEPPALWTGPGWRSPTARDSSGPGLPAADTPDGGGVPGIMSKSCLAPTSAIQVDHALVRQRSARGEQLLVQLEGLNVARPIQLVVDQGGPTGDHGVIDRVPFTDQLKSELIDGAAPSLDLSGRPPAPLGPPWPGRPYGPSTKAGTISRRSDRPPEIRSGSHLPLRSWLLPGLCGRA